MWHTAREKRNLCTTNQVVYYISRWSHSLARTLQMAEHSRIHNTHPSCRCSHMNRIAWLASYFFFAANIGWQVVYHAHQDIIASSMVLLKAVTLYNTSYHGSTFILQHDIVLTNTDGLLRLQREEDTVWPNEVRVYMNCYIVLDNLPWRVNCFSDRAQVQALWSKENTVDSGVVNTCTRVSILKAWTGSFSAGSGMSKGWFSR